MNTNQNNKPYLNVNANANIRNKFLCCISMASEKDTRNVKINSIDKEIENNDKKDLDEEIESILNDIELEEMTKNKEK